MCCSFRFNVSNLASDRNSGDIGAITKRRPASASQAAVTLCCNGDADVYSVAFAPGISAQRKVTTFAAQVGNHALIQPTVIKPALTPPTDSPRLHVV